MLEGCIVTIDAMGCQTSIAESIQEAGAGYVLRVKNNQEGLRADIERLFDRRRERGFEADYTDVDLYRRGRRARAGGNPSLLGN